VFAFLFGNIRTSDWVRLFCLLEPHRENPFNREKSQAPPPACIPVAAQRTTMYVDTLPLKRVPG